ncbi:MAG: FAD-dependent oxidoreductase [Desulfobacteraceae bacterium]|nr:FAD-dependent oxidoreductase [Desulfobacteraceae bacterium]
MAIRTGFYICHCGINIAGMVRVEEVADYARSIENVVVSKDYKFMCSDPGQELIEKDIKKFGLNRVVVASCSPRLHEKTFQSTCIRAGMNPYNFQMASVREQVSWVTDNRDSATRKAKNLSAAALNRVNFHQSLESRTVPINPDILVVGGGIAGMQAAIDIGNAGLQAYLVEKDTTIGGHMLQFDKTFPTLDCAACIGTPKMVETAQNPNIHLMTLSEIEEVSGYIGNYTVKVRKRARYVNDKCTGCSECTSVCPVSIPSTWDVGLLSRKAIYRSFPQAVPITFAIDKRATPPCRTTCPAGTNVQGYVQMVKIGNYQQALNLIMERLPLPGVLGRVCPHPCENDCRRALVDSAVSIRDLKRVAADRGDLSKVPVTVDEEKEQRVAVVGSGPAGLTVAYYLRQKGFQVTLFEARNKPGGMLRWGIPDYRLPPAVLDREIDHILGIGIILETNRALGRDFTLASLKEDGFDAVFLGLGTHAPVSLGIDNEDSGGVMDAVDFLNGVNRGRTEKTGNTVAVIGGGNVAMDAARVAVRLGAKKVIVVYRRSDAEMPADKEEIAGAMEEGVEFLTLAAPTRVLVSQGRVAGLECLKNELGPPDKSGRRRPVPVENSEFTVDCDMIVPAIGQGLDLGGMDEAFELNAWGTLKVDYQTMETSIPGVFAGGDAVTGPATVIEAVAAGHRVVAAMAQYLTNRCGDTIPHGDTSIEVSPIDTTEVSPIITSRNGDISVQYGDTFIKVSPNVREKPLFLDAGTRKKSFDEVDKGLSEEGAKKEAERCINCGGCCECKLCVEACQPGAVDHDMPDEIKEIKVGSIITATGFDPMDPSSIKQYGYGRFPNVFTNLEFERLSNATGPTGGNILIRDREGNLTKTPKSVAILHCIGSRDVNHHEYCSRVCCMYALKYGHLVHEKAGHDALVYNFYIDMRCFGKGYEEFYAKCQNEGTVFVRGKVAEITDRAESPKEVGKLVVISEDTLLGERIRIPVDMVVLCTAMEARKDAREVGRTLGINQGSDGFFLEEHPKLGPLSTATDGVFIAGACQGPKDIPDTVAQASGAAAKSLQLACRKEVTVSSTVSFIDPEICAGCKTCIGLCPYTAIGFDERRRVSVVNEALCKGCGSCSGFCPSGAAQVKHFNEKQLFAELTGVLDSINRLNTNDRGQA